MTFLCPALRRWTCLSALLCAFGLVGMPLSAQGGTEILRGRVLAADSTPVVDAEVVVAGAQSGATLVGRTNGAGQYTIVVPEGEGSYRLVIRKIGFAPLAMTAQRGGSLSAVISIADAFLTRSAFVLDAVIVTATPNRQVATPGDRPSVGSQGQTMTLSNLFALNPGDLMALVGSLPGVANVGDTAFSILGVSPLQNSILLDGAAFSGSSVPRDAIGNARLATTTFDPSRGDFAGGQLSVNTKRGTNYFSGLLRLERSDPRLGWADPASGQPVPASNTLSGFLAGPLAAVGRGQWHFAFDVSRSDLPNRSLLEPGPDLLALGLSPDSIARLRTTMAGLGIPVTPSGVSMKGPTRTSGSGLLRLDYRLNGSTSLALTANGTWQWQGGMGGMATAFPTSRWDNRSGTGRILLSATTYWGGLLHEVHVSHNRMARAIDPLLDLPMGAVQIGTEDAEGRRGTLTLGFGGFSSVLNRSNTSGWQVQHQGSWLARDGRHQVKASFSLTTEQGDRIAESGLGLVQYHSLADLANNQPSAYERRLGGRTRPYEGTRIAASLGDTWRAVPGRLEVQGGFRADFGSGGPRPPYHGAMDTLFGVVTNRLPRDRGLSPRLGFSWTPPWGGNSSAPVISTFMTDQGLVSVSRRGGGPSGGSAVQPLIPQDGRLTIAGGIGAFRGVSGFSAIGDLASTTGIDGGPQVLRCVGEATPVPVWDVGAPRPDRCLDETGPVVFGSTRPLATLIAPAFTPIVSWRANLQVGGLRAAGLHLMPSLLVSLGRHEESWVDLNLRRTPGFTLSGEGGRPVYAEVGDIVTATGQFNHRLVRPSARFGQVRYRQSDLQSQTIQMAIDVVPVKPLFGKVPIAVQYVYQHERRDVRGFESTTAGDPAAMERIIGETGPHQVRLTLTTPTSKWVNLAMQIDMQSGRAFTPMVGRDINGDGVVNDRAFVPTAGSSDPALVDALTAMMTDLSGGVTHCLTAQAGRVASANSCRAPWRARIDLGVRAGAGLTPGGSTGRLRFQAHLVNATTALARLFGLSSSSLLGGGQGMSIDRTLLNVTGFDPVTRSFQYQVNPRFGRYYTGGLGQGMSPFRVQVGASYALGGPPQAPNLTRFGLMPRGKAERLTLEETREALYRMFPDPMTDLLELRDSLGLEAGQVEAITAIRQEFRASLDSLPEMNTVIGIVLRQGRNLTDAELIGRLQALSRPVRERMEAHHRRAFDLLTTIQRSRTPLRLHPGL